MGYTPTVLRINPQVVAPQGQGCGSPLEEIIGSANQHVRKINPCLLTVKPKAPIAAIVRMADVNVIPVVVPAEFQGVRLNYLREVIL